MKKTLLCAAVLFAAIGLKAQSYELSVSSFDDFNAKWDVQTAAGVVEAVMDGEKFKNVNIGFGGEGEYATLKNSPITLAASKSNTAQFKIYVDYLQPNGDNRYFKIATSAGDKITIQLKDAFDLTKLSTSTGVSEAFEGSVEAGGSFTITATGSEVVLINAGAKPKYQIITIAGSEPGSFVDNPIADAIFFNGSEIVNAEGLELTVYNMLGKVVRAANTNISMNDLQNGIYVVRAEGVKGALKISK